VVSQSDAIHDDKEWMLSLLGDSRDIFEGYVCLRQLTESIDTVFLADRSVRKSVALQYGILEFLATEGANTIYRIKEDLDVPLSSVWNVIRKLETHGLVRIVKEDTWRTRLQRRYYSVTSIGLAPLLSLLGLRIDEEQEKAHESFETGEEWEGRRLFAIDRYQQIQKRFERDIDEVLSSIARKNVHLPVYGFFFQNWNEYEEALQNMIERRLDILKNFFDTKCLVPLFLDIIQLARSYCYMVKTGEFPQSPPFGDPFSPERSSDMLGRADVLRDFRRKTNRKIGWAYLRALSLGPDELPPHNIAESFRMYHACYGHEDKVWQVFFSTYGKMVEEEIEDMVAQYKVDLGALKALANIMRENY